MLASLFANPEFGTIFQKNPEYGAVLQRLSQLNPVNPGMSLQFALATINQMQQRNPIFNNNQMLTPNANTHLESFKIPNTPMTASTSSEILAVKDSVSTVTNNNNVSIDVEDKPKRRTRLGGGNYIFTKFYNLYFKFMFQLQTSVQRSYSLSHLLKYAI